jgi:hypothetical protein
MKNAAILAAARSESLIDADVRWAANMARSRRASPGRLGMILRICHSAPCLASRPRLEHGPDHGGSGPRFGAPWRGGRVVECTALEMRHRCKPIGGSNPSLSAISTPQLSPVSDCSNLPQGGRRIPRFCANSSRKLFFRRGFGGRFFRHYTLLLCIPLFESTAKTTGSAIKAVAASPRCCP